MLKKIKEKFQKNLEEDKNNWKTIHSDFSKKPYEWSERTYQQIWEEEGISRKDAQQWISAGLNPQDKSVVKSWKNLGFIIKDIKEWIKIGFKPEDHETIQKWKESGFNNKQVLDLINKGVGKKEVDFAFYLLENNFLSNHSFDKINLEEMRERYSVKKNDWNVIHSKFKEKYFSWGKTYQQEWENLGFTYQEAKELIGIGFKPEDINNIRKWKNSDFSVQEIKKLIEIDINNLYKCHYFKELKEKGISVQEIEQWVNFGFKLEKIECFEIWKKKSFSVKEFKQWIENGWNPGDQDKAELWKKSGFHPKEARSWIISGVDIDEWELALKLKEDGYQPSNPDIMEIIKLYSWKDVNFRFNFILKRIWEKNNFTKEEVAKWINIGFNPDDLFKVKEWKDNNFTAKQIEKWINIGILTDEWELVSYLEKNNFTPDQYKSFTERNAQKWLDFFFPLDKRKEIKILNISRKKLEGFLNLIDFINLEKLDFSHNLIDKVNISYCKNLKIIYCYDNELKKIDISAIKNLQELDFSKNEITDFNLNNCRNITKLDCSYNYLTEIDLSDLDPEKLKILVLSDNNLSERDLCFFSRFINLNRLHIGNSLEKRIKYHGIYNRFIGSLKPLQNMSRLEILDISNTDVEWGINYLPKNLKKFHCFADKRPESKTKNLIEQIHALFNDETHLPFAFKDIFVSTLKERGKTNEDEWENIHPEFDSFIIKMWQSLGFGYDQTKKMINIGLSPFEVDFANYLREKDKFPGQNLNFGEIEEERREYNKRKNISSYQKGKVKVSDQKYLQWLRVIKKKNEEFFNTNEEIILKEEYNLFLKEVENESKLGIEIIEKLIHFDHKKLNAEQDLIINQLVPNEKLRERYKKYGLCSECNQPNNSYDSNSGVIWCQSCASHHFKEEFGKWTSGDIKIDRFIEQSQLNAISNSQVLEWIPYKNFKNAEYIGSGGFSDIYKALWTDGYIENWRIAKKEWKRNPTVVALKILKNSQNIKTDILQEVTYHNLFTNSGINERVVKCHGISQEPNSKNYILVTHYITGSNLRNYLTGNYKVNLTLGENSYEELVNICHNYRTTFTDRYNQLTNITIALNSIHEKGLIHKDLHPGNILVRNYGGNIPQSFITDLGLCRPFDDANDGKVFGVIPYVAPEVLKGEPYTQASDVYSFSIIIAEVFSDLPPYHDHKWDERLATKICQGLRPKIKFEIPQLLKEIIERCWNEDPSLRPKTWEINETLRDWTREWINKKNTEYARQMKNVMKKNDLLYQNNEDYGVYQISPDNNSYSRIISTREIFRLQQSKEQFQNHSLENNIDIINEVKEKLSEMTADFNQEIKFLINQFIKISIQLNKAETEDEELVDSIEEIENELKSSNVNRKVLSKLEDYCNKLAKLEGFEEDQLECLIEKINS